MRRISTLCALISTSCLVIVAGCGDSGGGSPGPAAAADASQEAGAGSDTAAAGSDTKLTDTTATDVKADTGASELPKVDTKKDVGKPADDQISGAISLDPANSQKDDLAPTDDVDWYTFDGKKGDLVILQIAAQGTKSPFAADSIDTVLTLFGPDQKPYAFNDDPVPRDNNDSELYTILPLDGKYYVKVEECNSWLATALNVPAGASCAKPVDKTIVDYELFFAILDPTKALVAMDTEKGNDAASAIEVPYKKNQAGTGYIAPLIYGYFTDTNDVDVFMIKLPADVPVAADKRLSVNIEGFAPGALGNGSTSSPGSIGLSYAATPAAWLALSDFSNEDADLATPVTADVGYLLYVPHKGDKKGANDFYILVNSFGPGNPVEQKEADNNALAGAEELPNQQKTGLPKYFVEGNLGTGDVDHFALSVAGLPKTASKISVSCAAQMDGSGLRGLTADLLDAKGVSFGFAAETAKTALLVKQVDIPAGADKVILKLSFDKQEATVSGNYYRCGIHVLEPQAGN